MKISFIGAGSVVFTRNLLKDLALFPESEGIEIALMDIDPERLEVARKIAEEINEKKNKHWKIKGYMDLKSAIENSNYVINTVQIGGKEATYVDFDIPEKYGLKQTIGDTHGIGGIMRFLRTAPFLKDFVRNIEEYAPSALLLNFTNPMSMNQWYINDISEIETVGLCHSIPYTIEQISSYVGVPSKEVNYKVAGINHMAWVLTFERNGENLYPLLFKAMERKEIWERDPVRFEILRMFHYFVTESSEHNAEYVPYFIKDEELIKKLNIPIREYIRRVEENEKVFNTFKDYYLKGNKEAYEIVKEHYGEEEEDTSKEYAIQIIHGMETNDSRLVYSIVRNEGIIDNLPMDCMVEVPCYVDKNGVSPLKVGYLPDQLASLNLLHINVQRLAVRGAVERDKDYIYYAALLDPLASSILSPEKIHMMVDELLKAHKEYLKDLFIK
ncbi:alpha-glucosidase/alpha-galactosidase [Dictyoglomus thermophilum]|uniref:Alpha-glucosidase/alpha-galactosidase n=1 Tax=Dictyoglomus thermophilum TaxID=14 RepID=A0A7C2GWC0_DICTH|nr:alpha-glucosidase/alpha-galactosidase [Dictyoglomus thermophilum]TYT21048.1 alpha-glucosidase/alpha-galactosidase [Dictyoglomus thermophilum]